MSVRYSELRKSPRLDVNACAKIILMSGGLRITETFDCKVINISEGGALLTSDHAIKETEFYLEMKGNKNLVLCAVVRRESMHKVAVKFI